MANSLLKMKGSVHGHWSGSNEESQERKYYGFKGSPKLLCLKLNPY